MKPNQPNRKLAPKDKVYHKGVKKPKAIKAKVLSKNHIKTKNLVVTKKDSLYNELIKINAFYGDTSLRNHFTQDSFVYAYRNDYSMYNIHASILSLKKALHFLRKQKTNTLVFAGSPKETKEECIELFNRKKIPFFPTSEWFPGYISKKAEAVHKVFVIYDIYANMGAKLEAFNARFPIVGFFTIHADLGGVDYPISLNLDHCGIWYHSLWKSFFLLKYSKNKKYKL